MAPVALAIAFAIFLSLFAIETFVVSGGTLARAIAHLYPAMIVIITTIIASYLPKTGGYLFISLGSAYIAMGWGNFNWLIALSVIFLPLITIGIMFLAFPPLQKGEGD